MASLYVSSSVHTGDLVEKDSVEQMSRCFHSVHRVSAHDAAYWGTYLKSIY